MSDAAPLLSVIIVSYNTRQMTLDCLRCLTDDPHGIACEIFVVDNASTDGSPQAIRDAFPAATIIENRDNRGFGAANNQAIAASSGQYLLLLNSDAFVKPGAIAALLHIMNTRPDVAVAGPKLLNADGSMQRSCFRFPSPGRAWLENLWISTLASSSSALGDYRRWPHDQERLVDFVIGACMIVRREACERAGGFDERFFMYCEEADWEKRITQAGGKVLFTPAAQVTHLGGASGAAEKARINQHFFQSLDYYQIKHHGRWGLLMFRLAMIVGCTARAAGWAVRWATGPRRQTAGAKLKLRLWLIWRQATDWRMGL